MHYQKHRIRSENKKNLLKIMAVGSLFLLATVFLFVFFTSSARAVDTGMNYAAQIGLNAQDIRLTIAQVIRGILAFLGLIALLLILFAGWMWMSSEGNEEKVEKAKKILKNAIIGILIILSAFAITQFIINSLLVATGLSVDSSGQNGSIGGRTGGIGALGAGIIKSVYPEPGQTDVPRNTIIIVTFREKMNAEKICDSTVDQSGTKKCAPNAKIIKENIRIFETQKKDACQDSGSSVTGCDQGNVTDVQVSSNDNETFVFSPTNYLGSPTEFIYYAVYLSSALQKANGTSAFGDLSTGFQWSFQVNNKIDLTPPQVEERDIFPPADDEADTISGTEAGAAAQAILTVNRQPNIRTSAHVDTPRAIGSSIPAKVDGTYNCQQSGTITVSINPGKINNVDTLVSNVSGINGVTNGHEVAMNKTAALGCGLTLTPANSADQFPSGNSWTIAVTKEQAADTITLDDTSYVFVSGDSGDSKIGLGANPNLTAQNIIDSINNSANFSAVLSGSSITIKSKKTGSDGNNIVFSTSNSDAFSLTPFSGGRDRQTNTITKDKKDKPRNSVIQINFNETMNPLTLSGASGDLGNYLKIINASGSAKNNAQACGNNADCLSYKCGSGHCQGDFVDGKFLLSNQYRTVEFITNDECGVNACGQKIYCLPENSHLAVKINAAALFNCQANDANCSHYSPFTSCEENICNDLQHIRYPLSSLPLNGAADAANNSLDGNRNGNAYGPSTYYNENNPNSNQGDSYMWSFFISDKIDLEPPKIKRTDASHNQQAVDLKKEVSMNFNKVMMSYSLTTGSIVSDSGTGPITHKLINIWNFTNEPLGYWVTKENQDDIPKDGDPDWTIASLRHTEFSKPAKYRTQAGSGLKDIYQNCFRPCEGPACGSPTTINKEVPSCCSGTATSSGSCASGN